MKTIFIYIFFIAGALFFQGNLSGQALPGDDQENSLLIYPNPASGPVHIDFKSENRTRPEAVILDMTGKQVRKITEEMIYSDDHFTADINVAGLKPGIYFIKVSQQGTIHLSKIMIR